MTKKNSALLIALTLLSTTAGCNNTKENPPSVYTWHDITRAAMGTHGAYMQDFNSRENPTWSDDIPRQFWTKPIRNMKPLRVYLHLYHLVVVQKINGNIEEGIFINMPISSTIMFSGNDGFIFTEEFKYGYRYKRTIEK
ncbi:MAG: hypothetical protein KAJ07_03285 [Planctomycetes bacterium]|nr:hypothetical protein [Planctomycetota bacterium]